ncbi:hypothetical protein HZ326_29821 [Fusarium oxysporum f. sp. albedinis]|nr:hypothetical protein HZ326_29821 [Fusarium oxysporum f. sp. albedinis]
MNYLHVLFIRFSRDLGKSFDEFSSARRSGIVSKNPDFELPHMDLTAISPGSSFRALVTSILIVGISFKIKSANAVIPIAGATRGINKGLTAACLSQLFSLS